MPRVVDHEERRQQIAKVVEQLVLDRGVEALTIRDVASRVGCSTTVISHYFRTKLDMLLYTHREARKRAEKSLLHALQAGEDLLTALEQLLPMTEDRWRDWHTWFAFSGMAPADPSANHEWAETVSNANMIFDHLVVAAQAAGDINPVADPSWTTFKLQAFINGIAALAIQDPKSWPAHRQRELLQDMLRGLAPV